MVLTTFNPNFLNKIDKLIPLLRTEDLFKNMQMAVYHSITYNIESWKYYKMS